MRFVNVNDILLIIIKIPYPSIPPITLSNKLTPKIDILKMVGRNPIVLMLKCNPKTKKPPEFKGVPSHQKYLFSILPLIFFHLTSKSYQHI